MAKVRVGASDVTSGVRALVKENAALGIEKRPCEEVVFWAKTK